MIIDQSYSGQQIQLTVGEVAELRLPENPTTGYRWAVTSAPNVGCSLTDGSFRAEPGPPGQGGLHIWQLTAVRPGTCDVQLTYRRRFAADTPGNSVFTLYVRVTASPPP